MVTDEQLKLWVENTVEVFQDHNATERDIIVPNDYEPITQRMARAWGYVLVSESPSALGTFLFQKYKLRLP